MLLVIPAENSQITRVSPVDSLPKYPGSFPPLFLQNPAFGGDMQEIIETIYLKVVRLRRDLPAVPQL
jgi:hypothetical protein